MSETVLDSVMARLGEALDHNENVQEAPVALIWSDGGSYWSPVVERVRERAPVLTFGKYEPESATGPAYWLRCAVAGTIDKDVPDGTPIVYLPGVAREELRAIEACPPEIAPIAELQYRGQWFSHRNGKDWTVRGFLADSERGLGLQIADDGETAKALGLALGPFLDQPVAGLDNQYLDENYFLSLVHPDPVQTVLDWINDSEAFRKRVDDESWTAFVAQCRATYSFDPDADGVIVAAEKLGRQETVWAMVWERFRQNPRRYPGIPERLRAAKPLELVIGSTDAWPQDNEADEEQLRKLLLDLQSLSTAGARAEIARLEGEHRWRRGTVWGDLDHAPLAFALEHLALLAEFTLSPLASGGVAAIASDYAERGWRVDDAVLRALAAAARQEDRDAVATAVDMVYRPWLDQAATGLQAAAAIGNDSGYLAGEPVALAGGVATLFVDGLRFDIAERVRGRLASSGLAIESEVSLAALPTVTPTAKAALAPVGEGALKSGPDLTPEDASSGTAANIGVLRSLMTANGVQVLTTTDAGDPSGSAWAEMGDIDRLGHDFGVRLVDELDGEVDRITARVRSLLEAGWPQVDIVTDHGWLLLPSGMKKVELSPALTERKKGRCARLKPKAEVATPVVPWHWGGDVRIAVAPGATCFEANKVYEHGGISPQECVVLRLHVTVGAGENGAGAPEIASVKWLGLMCRIELSGVHRDVEVDLRGSPADAKTGIAEKARETSGDGRVSLAVPDEDLEGEPAYVVVVTGDGQVLAQREVTVGRNR